MDAVFVGLGALFVFGVWGLAVGCRRLGGPRP